MAIFKQYSLKCTCLYCTGARKALNALGRKAAGEKNAITPDLIREIKAHDIPELTQEFLEAICLSQVGFVK